MINDLLRKLKDIERQLHALQRLEVAPTPSSIVTYSGTPTAGRLAQWAGAGTVEQTTYAGSAVARYSGAPTAGAAAGWTANGTVAAAGFGTAVIARYSGTPSAGDMAYWTAAGTVATAGFGTAAVVRTSDDQTIAGVKTFSSRIVGSVLRAADGNGVKLEDDAGNVGLIVLDSGEIVVVGAGSFTEPYSGFTAQANHVVVVRQSAATSASTPFSGFVFANNQTGTSQNLAQLLFMNEAIGGDEKRLAQVLVQTDGATDDGRMIFRTFNSGVSADALALLSSGNAGFGTTAPQGKLHAHDGTGGWLMVTKTGVDGTAQTVIPNGTGDVTGRLTYMAAVKASDGSTAGASSNMPISSDAALATNFNLRVNADGSVDVRRTAGALTYTVTLWLVWN